MCEVVTNSAAYSPTDGLPIKIPRGDTVEKRYYNAASIERVLRAFERGYGLTSAEFYRSHAGDGSAITQVPSFHRQAWAGFYRTWLRLSGSGFAERAERELEIA